MEAGDIDAERPFMTGLLIQHQESHRDREFGPLDFAGRITARGSQFGAEISAEASESDIQ
jgi:hypothetical protein